jgi:hypothetical protein
MAITQTTTKYFKRSLLLGQQNFDYFNGDTFVIALYSSTANLNVDTSSYTENGEITGAGYSEGGKLLQPQNPIIYGDTAVATFNPITWTGAYFSAAGALIYNATNDVSVAVLDFGGTKTANGEFTIIFPVPSATEGIIRVV